MIGQSYSACALVKPCASVRTTRSNDSGVHGPWRVHLVECPEPVDLVRLREHDFAVGWRRSSLAVEVIVNPPEMEPRGRRSSPRALLLAMAAPSASASNFGHTTVGCTSGA